jgi:hypothetical protein
VLVCGAAERETNLPLKGTSLSLSRHVEGGYAENRGSADFPSTRSTPRRMIKRKAL